MMPLLFDPLDPPSGAWPRGNLVERRYIEEIARAGVSRMIVNVHTKWLALRSGERVFPVTVNEGEIGDSYVCLPHSAYILYAQEELDIVNVGALRPLLKMLISAGDGPIRASGVNKIVHVDNWLLSTNLHGDWAGEDLPAIRRHLVAQFPDHVIAIRSLDAWSCPMLLTAALSDGWRKLASRQIWVTDDLERDWRSKNSTQNDRRLIAKSSLSLEDIKEMSVADARRIAQLYHMLYVGKYSPLNPVFSADYITMTCAAGIIQYRVARDTSGTVMAVAGSFVRGDVMTPPIVGYDTTRSQSEGLYRIACYLFSDATASMGLRLNGSAGASDFKRHRGARGEIEYSVMFIDHLPRRRRAAITSLATILNRLLVPMMRRRGL